MEALTSVQRRVLGTLVEKAFTTPAAYPLTLNALVTGCNQLTCREPVTQFPEAEVSRAVQELKRRGLVKEADYDKGARVDRFLHAVPWDERPRAILAELLLRGPQTAGELKTNASRLTAIPDLAAVSAVLADFAAAQPPLVRELPRQPGKSSVRYDHLLYAEGEATSPAAPPAGLEERVAKLEADLAALRKDLEALRGSP